MVVFHTSLSFASSVWCPFIPWAEREVLWEVMMICPEPLYVPKSPSFHRDSFKWSSHYFQSHFTGPNFSFLLFFNNIVRQICSPFPWYRTALREFVVTVFHPCHQKLLPPLVCSCKGRITISVVNSRDPWSVFSCHSLTLGWKPKSSWAPLN